MTNNLYNSLSLLALNYPASENGGTQGGAMSVTIKERQIDDVTILEVTGRITLGEGSKDFRETLQRLTSEGKKKIILDLGATSYMDSSGYGELVSGFTVVTNNGGQFKICHLNKRIEDYLLVSKLYTVFQVFDDETTAIRSFR